MDVPEPSELKAGSFLNMCCWIWHTRGALLRCLLVLFMSPDVGTAVCQESFHWHMRGIHVSVGVGKKRQRCNLIPAFLQSSPPEHCLWCLVTSAGVHTQPVFRMCIKKDYRTDEPSTEDMQWTVWMSQLWIFLCIWCNNIYYDSTVDYFTKHTDLIV